MNGNCQYITLDSNEITNNGGAGIQFSGENFDYLCFVNNEISENGEQAVTRDPGGNNLEWYNNTVTVNGTDNHLTSRGFDNQKPTVSFVSYSTATAGEVIQFTNTSSDSDGNISHVLWDFGDGLPSTDMNPQHVYNEPGTYRVTLIVWDDNGRGARTQGSITISPDITAPASVTDLILTSTSSNSISFSWTATGDNGIEGRASFYDIRYDTSKISEDNWATAWCVVGETQPAEAGTTENFILSGLSLNTTYYIALKVIDDANNTSALSNILIATTLPEAPLAPLLESPPDNSVCVPTNPTLRWFASEGAASYRLQISLTRAFSSTLLDTSNLTNTEFAFDSLQGNTTFFWHVNASNAGGTSAWSNSWWFTTGATSVNNLKDEVSKEFALDQNWPNPFNAYTQIQYHIPRPVKVVLRIFNFEGQRVITIVEGEKNSGTYQVTWQGTNFEGNHVSSGLYFARLLAGDFDIKKITTLKTSYAICLKTGLCHLTARIFGQTFLKRQKKTSQQE
jgi:PKD repeat protein